MIDERLTSQTGGAEVRVVNYAPLETHPRHCHDTASISLILSGAIEESTRHGTSCNRTCSVVVKPPGVYHEDVYGPSGARTLQIHFPPDAAERFPGTRYAWRQGGPVARSMLNILILRRTGALCNDTALDNCLIELFAVIAEEDRSKHDRARPEWLDTLARDLRDSSTEPASVRKLADDARMHPVSLARAFRRHHGCSISEYIRRHRIRKACELIDEGAGNLAEVAMAAGFADQPHFTRAFRRETGITPARFRREIA